MTHEQIAAGIQAAVKFFDQPFLLRLIEIHHHVAAEDHIVALRQIFGFQIVEVEVNHLFQSFLDRIPFADFVEVAQAVAVVHRRHLVLVVSCLPARHAAPSS